MDLNLNDEQQNVVGLSKECGAVAIISAAGTGKTRTLISRIENLVSKGVKPEHILAITFTREAAKEMRERLKSRMGFVMAQQMSVVNFHQLALMMIRDHFTLCGFERPPTVVDAKEQRKVVAQCIEACAKNAQLSKTALDFTQISADETLVEEMMIESQGDLVKQAKSSVPRQQVDMFMYLIRSLKTKAITEEAIPSDQSKVYQMYLTKMKELQALDFSDMIPLAILLLERFTEILEKYQATYRYILCDEFQDVSLQQMQFLFTIARTSPHVMVFGDDDQSIYGWRGSMDNAFRVFKEFYPKGEILFLSQMYRSSATIVRAVRSVISQNRNRSEKDLKTDNQEGPKIRFLVCPGPRYEVDAVANQIHAFRKDHGLMFRDIAILARTRRVLHMFEAGLEKKGIPLKGNQASTSFLKNKDVLDVLAFGRLAEATDSLKKMNEAYLRVCNRPKRGFGKSVQSAIVKLGELRSIDLLSLSKKRSLLISRLKPRQSKSVLSFIDFIENIGKAVEKTDLLTEKLNAVISIMSSQETEDPIQEKGSIKDLLRYAKDTSASSLTDFARQCNDVISSSDTTEFKNDCVCVSTIHQAKGKEWELVFLCAFNDGTLPIHSSLNGQSDQSASNPLEEERRLCYVAMTRSKAHLVLSCSEVDSGGQPSIPSRFLSEIPQGEIERIIIKKDVEESSTPKQEKENKLGGFMSASAALDLTKKRKPAEKSEPTTKARQKSKLYQTSLFQS